MSNNFVTIRDIGYPEKKYGDICRFMRDTCLFIVTSSPPPPPPPPSEQASTIHGYFVSATPHTVISSFNQCSSHLVILRLWFLLCYVYLCALSSFANILTRKMEMAALFSCPTDV